MKGLKPELDCVERGVCVRGVVFWLIWSVGREREREMCWRDIEEGLEICSCCACRAKERGKGVGRGHKLEATAPINQSRKERKKPPVSNHTSKTKPKQTHLKKKNRTRTEPTSHGPKKKKIKSR